ncbi:uncharacterized protein [Typha angustifolia]|uniref:uncharacterized protein isoform X2 n=1 Tax=Typha angustifolia TaxID=59011 RepID=UPI003C2F7102
MKLNQEVQKVDSGNSISMVEEMTSLRSIGFSDPGWEHGVAQDERKKKVKCNYCGKIVSGGIYRLKQHLARISGEVTYCKKAPEEVYIKMKENLQGYRATRRRQLEDEDRSLNLQSNNDDEEVEESVGYKRKTRQDAPDQILVTNIAPLRSLGYVDPGWEHGVAQDEKKKKVKCNYCEKIVSGGINRFKQHLARIPGEVAYCKMAPEEVYIKMKENMRWHRTGRRRRPETRELSELYVHSENDKEEEFANRINKVNHLIGDQDVSCSKAIRKRSRGRSPNISTSMELQEKNKINLESLFAKTQKSNTPMSCKKSKQKGDKKGHKEVISAICKFFCYASLPFNTADSPYFHNMLDLVAQYGHGLHGSSSRLLAGRSLHNVVQTTRRYFGEIKSSWAITGCSIMADSWKDVQGKTIINFLVSCPRGMYFIYSLDASHIVTDATRLFNLLDRVVEDMGVENVVQVITENSACYKEAGKMLEEKRRSLFWTPCAAYCIDQILENFAKIKWVKECIDKGQRITRYIYNRIWLLNLMKNEFTEGKELLGSSVTKFATNFLILQNLLDHRVALKKMFQSRKWISSLLSKSDDGKEVERIILNSSFWKKMQYVKKSVNPIVEMLKKVDNNKGLSLPSLYNDMYRAKLSIKSVHGDDEGKYGPFWTVIDSHWNTVFNHPLYVAAYFLNPCYRYRPDFMALPEVIRGLNECITRLEPNNGRRVSAAAQISDFVFAKADFGTELALSTRNELDPAGWWQQHGINCLELQHIAIHILSQTCICFGSEHYWSTFDHIHSTRRNCLAQKRLKDLTYAHYNLRLQERQLKRMDNDSVSLDSVLLENLLESWIVETEKPASPEDEELLCNNMELEDSYESEVNETEDLDAVSTKSHTSIIALPETVEPLDAHSAPPSAASEEDELQDGEIFGGGNL